MAAASPVGMVPGLCRGAVSIGSARLVAAGELIAIAVGVVATPGALGLNLTPVESYPFVPAGNALVYHGQVGRMVHAAHFNFWLTGKHSNRVPRTTLDGVG